MKRIIFLILIALMTHPIFGQKKLSIIKATSTEVDIKEDKQLIKNAWKILPEAKLDIYTTVAKKITFYTNIDSISFNTIPNEQYDFVILLNGKDSAYTRIVCNPTRFEILKKGETYNYSDTNFIPKFNYESMDNANLIKLRKDFNLDSIAGNGSELLQIFNLMHWVHNLIKHDGNSENPKLKNAIDLIKVSKQENRGVNCRMLATILNECYLSIGIKSRFVTCMPRETEFADCHVINMVYSMDLNKWIWIDPTFDAYVMDEKGNLLSIQEVRARLISGQALVLNADANWNRENLRTKENYLEEYMVKNLYRFQTPILSEFDTETMKKSKEYVYVELLPLDGIEQNPRKKVETNTEKSIKKVFYITNNPNIFWGKPE